MADSTITRKDALLYGGAAVGGAVVGTAGVIALANAVGDKKTPIAGEPIVAKYVDGDIPRTDPNAEAWNDAQPALVALVAQQIAQPYLETVTVEELDVRGLHNGVDVALLLEWDDDIVDDLDGIRRYHDAVAVQLPVTSGGTPPALTMGAPGTPVHILQWRATWQRDIDSGGNTGVDQIYPEVVHDIMPDDILPPDVAQLYWVGREAGNPLSQNIRSTPVEEVIAEGFGSSTHAPNQSASGHAVNEDGRWKVVVSIPSARAGVGEALAPGTSWPVSFAVWLGSDENRGARKHIGDWQTLVLEDRE
jgi:hypothetical protein